MSRFALVAFTQQGGALAKKIAEKLEGAALPVGTKRAVQDGVLPIASLSQWTADQFANADGLIFVGACGIAVRSIAPFLQDKRTDPAVVVVDEKGQFVISLLSGHVGGANELAVSIASAIGAMPVITTATDRNNVFAVDVFAEKNNLLWTDRTLAKEISAALLSGEPVGFESDYPVVGNRDWAAATADLGICIARHERSPFNRTFWLQPKNLVLGIGCRKGVPEEEIERVVNLALAEADLSLSCVSSVCSIDRKAEEAGLLSFCEKWGITPTFYTAEALSKAEGDFTVSDFVQQTVGIDNVCERSAVLGGNRLLGKKFARDGVTVAIAEQPWILEITV